MSCASVDEPINTGDTKTAQRCFGQFNGRNILASRAGDFSDVTIADADERRIPWPEASHSDDDAMRELMRPIVDLFYIFHVKAGAREFQAVVERGMPPVARRWDATKLDAGFMAVIEGPLRH